MQQLDHIPIAPDVVPPMAPYQPPGLDDHDGCPVCSRTYTQGWHRARKLILARFSGEPVWRIARRFLMTPGGVRYHLRAAGVLSDATYCAHVSMMRTRYRISPADLIAAGAVLNGDMWYAPPVVEPRKSPARKLRS